MALVLAGSTVLLAQTAPLSGTVVVKKDDGTTEPAQGATVEVYRTDIKGKFPSAKTNKKGEFSFAGLPLGATFVFSVSGPNIAPTYLPNVRAGVDKIVINTTPGDGKKWTEEEVRKSLSSPTTAATTTNNTKTSTKTDLTAEQKKAMEEQAKITAEITEKNKKIEGENAILQAAMKAGNEAFNSKNYDVAIAKYDEGYNTNQTFIGSAPGFLNNKAAALTNRGVDTYNQTVKMTDAAAKVQNYTKATKDFSDAVDAYNASWTILKNAPAAEITNQQSFDSNKQQALNGFRSVVKYMIQTEKVDPAKVPVITSMLGDYLAFETDPVKKTEAEVFLGDIYRINGDSENAIIEYKKVLAKSPTNIDALAGLGLSQANAGYNKDGTINDAMMQEAINNLQRFSDTAPENHKLKASVKETVDYLKTQNFKPQKTTTKKKS